MGTDFTTGKSSTWRDRRTVLAALWVFVLLNFVYADIFTLFFDPAVSLPTDMSSGSVFFFAVVMETAIAMVLLCRILPRAWNRWTNVGLAWLHIAVLVYSLTGQTVTSFYAFFATIELATLTFVVGYAWTWRKQPEVEPVAVGASV